MARNWHWASDRTALSHRRSPLPLPCAQCLGNTMASLISTYQNQDRHHPSPVTSYQLSMHPTSGLYLPDHSLPWFGKGEHSCRTFSLVYPISNWVSSYLPTVAWSSHVTPVDTEQRWPQGDASPAPFNLTLLSLVALQHSHRP